MSRNAGSQNKNHESAGPAVVFTVRPQLKIKYRRPGQPIGAEYIWTVHVTVSM